MTPTKFILIVTLLAMAAGCTDNPGSISGETDATYLILNEGAFGQSNASISTFNPATRELQNNVFASRNAPRVLGDVLQSAIQHENRLYLVVNNSKKIEVVDSETFISQGSVNFSGAASPRYMAVAENNQAFVTSLFTDFVYQVDLSTRQVVDSVNVGAGSEGIVYTAGKLFVARNLNADFSTASGVAVVDPATLQVEMEIPTGPGPQQMTMAAGSLWLNETGTWGDDNGALVQINPSTRVVAGRLELGAGTSGIAGNETRQELYLISNGILKINLNDSNDTTRVTNRNIYGISVLDNDDDYLYAFDAKNFAQSGTMLMYDGDGTLKDSLQAGIAPKHIMVLNQDN
ncbi:MAG: B12-regulated liporotein [Bacteroidetes bacterium HLUCCA01]|nr:MAG: B12-regulated liporotein [Bacteroidetes bacterium HLUCCA01]